MTLSIVVIARNHEHTLPAVLRAAQDLTPKEVVVVDDGSTDRTVQQALDAGVKVVSHLSPFGPGMAVMTALKHTRGETVMLLDAGHTGLDAHQLWALAAPLRAGHTEATTGVRPGLRAPHALPCVFTRRSVHYLNAAGQDAVLDLLLRRTWADNGVSAVQVTLTGLPRGARLGLRGHVRRFTQAARLSLSLSPARH